MEDEEEQMEEEAAPGDPSCPLLLGVFPPEVNVETDGGGQRWTLAELE